MSTVNTKKNIEAIVKAVLDVLLDEEIIDQDNVKEMTELLHVPVSKELKKMKLKVPTDPLKPKRPPSGYILYSSEINAEVRSELKKTEKYDNKQLTGAVSKVIGARWRKLSDKEKKPYLKKAEDAKAEYLVKMEDYTPPTPAELAEKTVSKRKAKDPNAPKGVKGSFIQYSGDVRAQVKEENPDAKVHEISKIIGAMWKALSDEEKAPFEARARADRERYNAEMEEYNASGGAENAPKKASKKAPKKASKKVVASPPKTPKKSSTKSKKAPSAPKKRRVKKSTE